jgi:alanyl-tRNA synthetase
MHRAFIYRLTEDLAGLMGDAFPEIRERREHISDVIRGEEESFGRTLDRGIELFADLAMRLKREGQSSLPGEEAFRLYDTYGFPLDLTQLMAREQNLIVDLGFECAMQGSANRPARR